MLIYEAHIGMAQEEARIGTYREFADKILPRIQALGYNADSADGRSWSTRITRPSAIRSVISSPQASWYGAPGRSESTLINRRT